MKSWLKQLGKDTLIYSIGQFALKGVGFITIPIYTRIFSPADYGIIGLISMAVAFWGVFVGMGTSTAVTFYFNEEKETKSRASVVTATLQLHLIGGVAVAFLVIIGWPLLDRFLFRGEVVWHTFVIALVGMLLGHIMGSIRLVFRLTYRSWLYVSLGLSSSLIFIVASLILVVWLDLGVLGYFVGSAISSFTAAIVGWLMIRDYISWEGWRLDLWRKLLIFGIPLVPAEISTYFLFSLDRWLINHYLTSHDLGLYTVAAKLAVSMSTIVYVFMQAFMPLSMDVLQSDNRGEMNRFFETTFRYYCGLSLALVIIITGLSPYLLKILTPPEYFEASKIIGIMALPAVFFGGTYFSSLGSWKVQKTYLYSLSVVVALVVGVVLGVLLIPRYGLIGASVSTAIAMFSLVVTSFYFSQKHWRIDFNIPLASMQTLVCAFAICAFLFGQEGMISGAVAHLLMGTALCTLMLISVKPSELSAFQSLVRQLSSRIAKSKCNLI